VYLSDVQFHDPATLAEAAALLEHHAPDARLLAGGTDLLVDLKTGRRSVRHVVSVKRISELRGISATDAGLRIGALVTPNELGGSDVVQGPFVALTDATRELAAPQVRNMATIGGNIAGAIPSADMPPILIVMDASVILWSARGERTVPVASVFTGPRETSIAPDEILTSIQVPMPPRGFGAAFARFAHRQANSCAVAGVAASVQLDEKEIIRDAHVAMSAVAPTPKTVAGVAEVLAGKAADDSTFDNAAALAGKAAVPITDIRGTADFRSQIVAVLTKRALTSACQRARELQQ
jgi:carbon-monoxide dehydrogenase medium subunit